MNFLLFQKWLEISMKKYRQRVPRCELCNFEYIRRKRFRVSSQLRVEAFNSGSGHACGFILSSFFNLHVLQNIALLWKTGMRHSINYVVYVIASCVIVGHSFFFTHTSIKINMMTWEGEAHGQMKIVFNIMQQCDNYFLLFNSLRLKKVKLHCSDYTCHDFCKYQLRQSFYLVMM